MTRDEYTSIVTICASWYPKKKREHGVQVETYVIEDTMFSILPEDMRWFIRTLAYAHDVIEDTMCPIETILVCIDDPEEREDFKTDLLLLTHDKTMSYYEYVRTLVESRRMFPILVKRADMKDHLVKKKTLTPRLKAKYEPVLPMLFYNHGVLK
jgi:hypothetical protein